MAIIVSKDGKGAQKLEEQGVADEGYLQAYVAGNPNTLPLDALKEDPRLLVVSREFRTRSGPIDVLAIDRDGDLYIVETKLFKNPDKRRVIAQMLDYGASLWKGYDDSNAFIDALDAAIAESGGGRLRDQIRDAYGLDDAGVELVVAMLKRNLTDGNIKFVVLMDKLHEHLRDLILFINQKSRFDILAVEMEFYRHEGLEIVIPRLYGAEVRKEVAAPRDADPKYVWDEARFTREATRGLPPTDLAAVTRLIEFSKSVTTHVEWKCLSFQGGGKAIVTIPRLGNRRLYHLDTDGTLLLDFQNPDAKAGRDLRDRFREELVRRGFVAAAQAKAGAKVELEAADWVGKLPAFLDALTSVVTP